LGRQTVPGPAKGPTHGPENWSWNRSRDYTAETGLPPTCGGS
jgi:hypothetical protein